MPLDEMITRDITGINPFNELRIDAEIWREAHDHHRAHQRLHALAAHRPGIGYGLEVVPSATTAGAVVVAPGVGIDDDGQVLVLSEAVKLTLTKAGQTFILMTYKAVEDPKSAVSVGSGKQKYRFKESCAVVDANALPRGPYLELARVFRSSASSQIRVAASACDPGKDEVDPLHRRMAFPRCFAAGAIGEVDYVAQGGQGAWKPNRAGLLNLIREANANGFSLDFSGPMDLQSQADTPDPLLLYMAGGAGMKISLAAPQVQGLRRYLEDGGVLVGESSGGQNDFAMHFYALSRELGANLQPVEAGHPLLNAHCTFGKPPRGAADEGLLAADPAVGVVFSSFDYGGAWQGTVPSPDDPLARTRIRAAQEFGLNLVAYASARRRGMELARMG